MSDPYAAFSSPASSAVADPYAAFSSPAQKAAPQKVMNYDRDQSAVRADIGGIADAALRERAVKEWANHTVAKEEAAGGVGRYVDNAVRTVARGSFLGPFLDEANALVSSGVHKATLGMAGAPYDEAVAYQRARDRYVDDTAPVLSTATQLATGVVTGGVAAGAVRPVVARIGLSTGAPRVATRLTQAVAGPVANLAPAATNLGRVAQGAAMGAGYGAVGGFGDAEGGIVDRAEGAAKGATVGAALGGAATGAIQAYQGGRNAMARQGEAGANETFRRSLGEIDLDQLANMIATGTGQNLQQVQRRTFDIIGEEMTRHRGDHRLATEAALTRIQAESRVTLGTARENIRNITGVHQDSPHLMAEYPAIARENVAMRNRRPENVTTQDASRISGSGAHEIVDYLANNGGRAADQVRTEVTARQQGMQDWFLGRLRTMAPEGQTIDDAGRMIDGVRDMAHQAYQAAYNGPINTRISQTVMPQLLRWYEARAGARAGEASDAMRMALREFMVPQGNGLVPATSLQHLQDARGAVRGMIDAAQRNGRGHILNALTPLYGRVTRVMEAMSPQWATANRQWAGMAGLEDALDLGTRMATKAGPAQRDAIEQFRLLAPPAQDLVRVGWLQQQADKIAGLRDTHDVSKLFDTPQTHAMVRHLFGQREGVHFTRAVRDAELAQRTQAMLGNSRTHMRSAAAKTLDADLGVAAAVNVASRSGLQGFFIDRLTSFLRDRRNVPLAQMATTPMRDVYAVAQNVDRMRSTQERMRRLEAAGPMPAIWGGVIGGMGGRSIAAPIGGQ